MVQDREGYEITPRLQEWLMKTGQQIKVSRSVVESFKKPSRLCVRCMNPLLVRLINLIVEELPMYTTDVLYIN